MLFNRSLATLAAALLIALALAARADAQDATSGGLLGYIMSPIKATFDRAKNMLSARGDDLGDKVDKLRVESFKVFMRVYNKSYSPDEIPKRMNLFVERRKIIEQSVKAFREGRSTFAMSENEFTDWDDDEIKKLTGVSPPSPDQLTDEEKQAMEGDDNEINVASTGRANRTRRSPDDQNDEFGLSVRAETIPASRDWRASGCVATPLNQLKCGACYAIATMGVVEAMRCLNQVSSPTLSPQQIVDCATPRAGYQNFGCDGGWPTRVLKYLQDTGTAAREACYPFVRKQNTCKMRQVKAQSGCTVSASPTDTKLRYKVLNNERDILYHVAATGPVVTVMRATDKFLYYAKGIFDDPTCSRKRDDVDHAIQITGYGQENGVDYWLIKNSWGTTTWGEGGYGKYKRGTNACSIGHWGWAITS